ncbi:MAG: SDR family oxidoreductase [Comamonadaceae bacterium]|nr:MAG: SDR family oxidoreductase [Comamonadaceae bacterium]
MNEATGEAAAQAARAGAADGGDAFAVRCDVSQRESVEAALAATLDRYGRLDILYNNAGGSTVADGKVTDTTEEEFWRAITLDLFGTFLCCKLGVPALIKAGGGCVINTTSIAGIQAFAGHDCYTSAKGGVAALTRSMAVEYAAQKIRVNALAPAVTLSDRVRERLAKAGDVHRLADKHLLGLVEPIDVAMTALYLASDEARMMTGQIVSIDSGASVA